MTSSSVSCPALVVNYQVLNYVRNIHQPVPISLANRWAASNHGQNGPICRFPVARTQDDGRDQSTCGYRDSSSCICLGHVLGWPRKHGLSYCQRWVYLGYWPSSALSFHRPDPLKASLNHDYYFRYSTVKMVSIMQLSIFYITLVFLT